MSVHDAEPGDIYVDSRNVLWRVVGVYHEPTVIMQRINGDATRDRQSGGVSGPMWSGYKRIHRPESVKLPERPVGSAWWWDDSAA